MDFLWSGEKLLQNSIASELTNKSASQRRYLTGKEGLMFSGICDGFPIPRYQILIALSALKNPLICGTSH